MKTKIFLSIGVILLLFVLSCKKTNEDLAIECDICGTYNSTIFGDVIVESNIDTFLFNIDCFFNVIEQNETSYIVTFQTAPKDASEIYSLQAKRTNSTLSFDNQELLILDSIPILVSGIQNINITYGVISGDLYLTNLNYDQIGNLSFLGTK